MKVIASRAMASMASGTVPLEDATPALLNKMTSRSPAKASLNGWIVVVQGAHEVLEEHQRKTSGDPETAVREAYPPASTY